MLADLGTPTLKQVIAGARATLRALPPAKVAAMQAELAKIWERCTRATSPPPAYCRGAAFGRCGHMP